MEYLYYQRITKIGNGSLEAYWDLAKDYHHFMHAHRKHFKNVFILHEDENTQVMFYQSRIFYPLPFIKNYISCKYLDHDNKEFKQAYRDISKPKDTIWFDFKVRKENDKIVAYNTLKFPVGGILRHFPKLFSKVVDFKLARMWEEDKEILESRGKVGLYSNDKCLPDSNVLSDHLMANLDNISDLPNHFKNGEGKYTYQYF